MTWSDYDLKISDRKAAGKKLSVPYVVESN